MSLLLDKTGHFAGIQQNRKDGLQINPHDFLLYAQGFLVKCVKRDKKTSIMEFFWRIVISFAVSQTLIWGTLYYSFTKLLPTWVSDTSWSLAETAAGLTIALLVSAACSPVIGRLIDKQRGTIVLTGSCIWGAICLLLLSQVHQLWQFYAVYVGLGIAMSGALYDACFGVLTKTMGAQTRRAITIVTLAAGFASTIAFPSIFALEKLLGWRQTLWVLAATTFFIVAPLQWYGAHLATKHRVLIDVTIGSQRRANIGRNPIFWLLAIAYATIAYNHSAILNHLFPLLDERGIGEQTAVFAASMIGPMQVGGRVIMLMLERRVSSVGMFVSCFLMMIIAAVALLVANIAPLFLILFVIGQGAGNGVTSIMKPLTTAQFMGREKYGVIAGWLSIPVGIAAATAPTIAAIIHGSGGYNIVILVGLGAVITGLVSLLIAARYGRQQT